VGSPTFLEYFGNQGKCISMMTEEDFATQLDNTGVSWG